jgi:Fungal N-terminal domain of STAND proteins
MASAFGFSVGDFVNAITLVTEVIGALKDSAGSSAQFVELMKELYGLEIALLYVKATAVQPDQEPQLAAIKQSAAQCQATIDHFLQKNKKFQRTLRSGGSKNPSRDVLHKIEWALFKAEEINEFRAKLRGHTSSINMLLISFQM